MKNTLKMHGRHWVLTLAGAAFAALYVTEVWHQAHLVTKPVAAVTARAPVPKDRFNVERIPKPRAAKVVSAGAAEAERPYAAPAPWTFAALPEVQQSVTTPASEQPVDDSQEVSTGDEAPSAEDVRAFFLELFPAETVASYSDEALLSEGASLLESLIQDEEADVERTLSAAYALNELTGESFSTALSRQILDKAQDSGDQDALSDALMLITDQHHPNPGQLAVDLLDSVSPEAQAAGIYMLAAAEDRRSTVPMLRDRVRDHPEETLRLMVGLIDDGEATSSLR